MDIPIPGGKIDGDIKRLMRVSLVKNDSGHIEKPQNGPAVEKIFPGPPFFLRRLARFKMPVGMNEIGVNGEQYHPGLILCGGRIGCVFTVRGTFRFSGHSA
jgi:hypothetical protein